MRGSGYMTTQSPQNHALHATAFAVAVSRPVLSLWFWFSLIVFRGSAAVRELGVRLLNPVAIEFTVCSIFRHDCYHPSRFTAASLLLSDYDTFTHPVPRRRVFIPSGQRHCLPIFERRAA